MAFTRNPSTGENKFYGEYLMNAQGEDVVAGIRTPQPIATLAEVDRNSYKQLVAIRSQLEKHYRDMQDLEFTIEQRQAVHAPDPQRQAHRRGGREVAVDLVKEGLITEEEAVMRVEPQALDQLLHPTFDPKAEKAAQQIAKGLPACPGAGTGQVVFSAA